MSVDNGGARLELTTVRGIACVALVAYHVIGPTSASGMHLPDSSGWHYAMNSLDFLRMPIFSVVSGFVYARHRVSREMLGGFLRKKVARLGVPLLFLTAVMLMLRRRVYGDETSLGGALFFHYQHLWFIQALLVLFTAIALWDAFARPGWPALLVAAFGSVLISRSFAVTDFLSINGAFYLAPFFLFGMVLRLEDALLQRDDLVTLAAWLVGTVLLVNQAVVLLHGEPIIKTSLPAAVCGIGGSYLLLARCPKVRLFDQVGSYSYTIYLWHSVASSALRHVVERWTPMPQAMEFAALLVAGLGLPILIHRAVEGVPVLSLLMAGIRRPSRISAREGRRIVQDAPAAHQVLERMPLPAPVEQITDFAA